MIAEEKLRSEIQGSRLGMATAPEAHRNYQIGALAALMWAAGDYDRGTAFAQACQAWDQARPKGNWLTDLLQEIKAAPEDDPRYSVLADLVERHEQEGRP